jgi:mannose-1-phosphate guanylyltransferase
VDPLYHVILAGGSGTRFWPESRRDRPKQFLALAGPEPMIAATYARCAASGPEDRIHVSGGLDQRDRVLAALPRLSPPRFIGEPVARNTAPAIGLSAMVLFLADPDAVAVFCPSDHVVADAAAFREAIARAAAAAASGDVLVTLGIAPSRPETGYGYIEAGEESGIPGVRRAARFTEKPDPETAATFAASGRHYWNSGIFIWKAASILAAIGRHHPGLARGLARIRDAARAAAGSGRIAEPFALPGVAEAVAEVFAGQPSISIDYAVMEKAPNVLVVPCDPGWSDVGSWDAAAEMAAADAAGNTLAGDVVGVDARGCFVRAGGRPVALVGVEDLIVVDAGDAILVCRKGRSQKVREVVAELARRGRGDLT